jgi:hypothetical protein
MFVTNFLYILLNYRPSNDNSKMATQILCQDLSSYRLSDVQYLVSVTMRSRCLHEV